MTTTRQTRGPRVAFLVLGLLAGLAGGPGGYASGATVFEPEVIYATSAPAVVFVAGVSGNMQMSGAGSIIHRDGLVLTNAHVVINKDTGQPYERLWVYFKPAHLTGDHPKDLSRRVKAQVMAADRDLDLAVLKLDETPQPLSIMLFGDSDRVHIGERVAAIGHPEQGGLWSLTTGVISASFDDYSNIVGKHMFQTEASFNRGNSGGPLVNADGQQVGINTSVARLAKDGFPITSVNFSVKSGVARTWLAQQGVQVAVAAPVVLRPMPSTGGLALPEIPHYELPPVVTRPMPSTGMLVSPSTPPAPQPEDRRPAEPTVVPALPPVVQAPQVAKPVPQPPAPKPKVEPLPPPRPFNMEQLLTGLDLVEQDLEQQMKQMEHDIRTRH